MAADGKKAEERSAAQLHARTSRERYNVFVDDYKHRRLDDETDKLAGARSLKAGGTDERKPGATKKVKRRAYLREYVRWLRPYRYAIGLTFFLALLRAGLEMIEPLF